MIAIPFSVPKNARKGYLGAWWCRDIYDGAIKLKEFVAARRWPLACTCVVISPQFKNHPDYFQLGKSMRALGIGLYDGSRHMPELARFYAGRTQHDCATVAVLERLAGFRWLVEEDL